MPEGKEDKSAVTFDEKVEELYGQEKPSAPEEEKPKPEEAGTPPGEGEEKPEGEEETPSKAIEDKLLKIAELLGDDEEAIEAYIKKKGYHNDPAWRRQRELIEKYKKGGAVSDGDKEVIESVKKLTSSPEGIRLLMKHEGYTDEAINARLRELGHSVPEGKEDDFGYVLKTLGVDVAQLDDNGKNYVNTYIADVVKIASMLIDRKLEHTFPEKLKPFEENLKSFTRERTAAKYASEMEEIVSKHGVLDFEKDIEPKLLEFAEANPEAKQEDVVAYFKEIYPDMLAERSKTGKRKEERDEKKEKGLRGEGKPTPGAIDLNKLTPVTGSDPNEVSKGIDRLIGELGIE